VLDQDTNENHITVNKSFLDARTIAEDLFR